MDPIDQKKLHELYGCEETSKDILHMFTDRSDQLINELKTALENNNKMELAQVCHKGIGQARYIACPLLEETLIELQNADNTKKENHLKRLKVIINAIKKQYA